MSRVFLLLQNVRLPCSNCAGVQWPPPRPSVGFRLNYYLCLYVLSTGPWEVQPSGSILWRGMCSSIIVSLWNPCNFVGLMKGLVYIFYYWPVTTNSDVQPQLSILGEAGGIMEIASSLRNTAFHLRNVDEGQIVTLSVMRWCDAYITLQSTRALPGIRWIRCQMACDINIQQITNHVISIYSCWVD